MRMLFQQTHGFNKFSDALAQDNPSCEYGNKIIISKTELLSADGVNRTVEALDVNTVVYGNSFFVGWANSLYPVLDIIRNTDDALGHIIDFHKPIAFGA